MITSITKEQQELIPQYIKKWVDLASEPIDRKKINGIFKKIYGEKKIIIIGESFQNTIDLIKVATEGKKLKYDNQLDSQLHSQLYSQLDSQLHSQLDSQFEFDSQLDSQNINYSYYISYYLYDWAGYYDYAKKIGVKFEEKSLQQYFDILLNISIVIFLGNVIFVCEKPKCLWNNRGDLHSEHLPAIGWKDKTGFYFLNGVRFKKELWEKVVKREMPMEEVLKITDIDQRTQAIKFAKTGLREFYLKQDGKKIDEIDKLDPQMRVVHYELWKIPKGEIFSREVHFVIYDCPSSIARGERQEYAKGVPEFEKVADALAWGMSDEEHKISGTDWLALKPLIEES